MADLKERLRACSYAIVHDDDGCGCGDYEICIEAADYIEALEAALRETARTDDTGTVTHRLECRQRLARAVLEERG